MAGSPKGETRNASTNMAMHPVSNPAKKAADCQQDKNRTRKAAARPRDAGEERDHRHGEDQHKNKGGHDNF